MAEYIDRETIKEIMQKYRCSDCTSEKSLDCPLCQLHKPFAEISQIPTADVVSKSEYDRLEKSFNELKQEAKGYLNRIYGIRADVAREIFEYIEERLLPSNTSGEFRGDSIEWFDYYDLHLAEDIAELKKKYIQEF